jgi:predicted enzyme related to lactoylglutathione lyase
MANPVVHFEVIGKDGKALQDFYSGIFGWKVDATNPMNYGIVNAEDTGGGIGGGLSAGDGHTNGLVTFYIAVQDPEETLKTVEAQGGKIVMPVMEIPGMVRLAQFADPEGNIIGIIDANYGPQQ